MWWGIHGIKEGFGVDEAACRSAGSQLYEAALFQVANDAVLALESLSRVTL